MESEKVFMIIAEIPKANHCSFFCFLLTIDECIINVWGYTEILPKKVIQSLKLGKLRQTRKKILQKSSCFICSTSVLLQIINSDKQDSSVEKIVSLATTLSQ